ncbi:MAG TPA: tetratricopeptide repeat protein [Kofleriaceae bacterium]|nr:tetratricopeptide repeat protein [Kofleriaceae bacterium]
MRSLAIAIVLLHVPAVAADPSYDAYTEDLGRTDTTLIQSAPSADDTQGDAARLARIARLDRQITSERDVRTRATFVLERAELWATLASHARIAQVAAELARLETADDTSRRAHQAEATRQREARTQAANRALADYTELACDPADRSHALACAEHPALRDWPRLPQALAGLAALLAAEQRRADALTIDRRLVERFPRSQHAARALLAIAEDTYASGDLKAAELLYRRVLAHPAARELALYARFKLAWVQLGLDRGFDAFESFALVARAPVDRRSALLVAEARKELARAYSLVGSPAAAYDAFEHAAPGHALALLERLAGIWVDARRTDDAIAVFGELARRSPGDDHRCVWQVGIVEAILVDNGTQRDVVRELELAMAQLAHLQASGADDGTLAVCRAKARSVADEVTRNLSRAARGVRDKQLFADADRAYAAYIAAFTGDSSAPRLRIDRAQLAQSYAARAYSRAAWQVVVDRYDEAIGAGDLAGSVLATALRERDEARTYAAAP